MLKISIPEREIYNEKTKEFIKIAKQELRLEHSLISLEQWEMKHKRPFFNSEKTAEEILDYIKFMTINQNVQDEVYYTLSVDDINAINSYIEDPMTATTFTDIAPQKKSKQIITNELIYYSMIAFNIPWECRKWHLDRLTTLIRVCEIKNAPQDKNKKCSKKEIINSYKALNEARRKANNSNG